MGCSKEATGKEAGKASNVAACNTLIFQKEIIFYNLYT
jgi:hypothetical protein